MVKIIKRNSPNFDDRPADIEIDVLMMHYTGMQNMQLAMDRLCDAASKVSCHYLIDENGDIYNLVDDSKRAWHAGISCWNGKAALNENSIGIELVNPGHEFGYRPFKQPQMQSLVDLSHNLIDKYNILPNNIVGHSDVAPVRKNDPGELFDWKFLSLNNIGLWPEVKNVKSPSKIIIAPGDEKFDVIRIQSLLNDYGYHIRADGYFGYKTEAVIKAFKRRFVQNDLSVFWSNYDQAILEKLVSMI